MDRGYPAVLGDREMKLTREREKGCEGVEEGKGHPFQPRLGHQAILLEPPKRLFQQLKGGLERGVKRRLALSLS